MVTREGLRSKIGLYLDRLAAGDLPGVLALFAEGAVVNSPLYGRLPATRFYEDLFGDTARSQITPLEVFDSAGEPGRLAVRFRYDWTLSDGTPTSFDCVDVVEFDDSEKIRELTIIYDTHPLRPAWEGRG